MDSQRDFSVERRRLKLFQLQATFATIGVVALLFLEVRRGLM